MIDDIVEEKSNGKKKTIPTDVQAAREGEVKEGSRSL